MRIKIRNILDKIIDFFPAGLYNGLIWHVSSRTHNVQLVSGFDKVIHLVEYAALGFLLAFAFKLNKKSINRVGQDCFLLGVVLGAVDEFHQYFVPGRSSSIFDLFADIAGIALGMFIWMLWCDIKEKTGFLKK